MTTSTMQTVAALLGSGRVEGDVTVSGTVTRASLRTTAAGHDWAVITLDDGTDRLDVHVLPRVWRDAACPVRLGGRLTVAGRLDAAPEGLTILASNVTTDQT